MGKIDVAILCGGPGMRMRPRTATKQKCLIEVAGKPILEHVLDAIVNAFGNSRVFLVTAYLGIDVGVYFGQNYRGLQIQKIYSPLVKGTRLALADLQDHLTGDFLMMHGDVVCSSRGLVELQQTFERDQPRAAVLVATMYDMASTHGIVTFQGNKIDGLEFPPKHLPYGITEGRYMGIDWLSREIFQDIARFPNSKTISGVLHELILEGRNLRVVRYEEQWYHFALPEDLNINKMFDHRVKPKND